jgi:hypothetical protein
VVAQHKSSAHSQHAESQKMPLLGFSLKAFLDHLMNEQYSTKCAQNLPAAIIFVLHCASSLPLTLPSLVLHCASSLPLTLPSLVLHCASSLPLTLPSPRLCSPHACSSYSYYYLTGSLTTPPCTENVKWVISAKQLTIPGKRCCAGWGGGGGGGGGGGAPPTGAARAGTSRWHFCPRMFCLRKPRASVCLIALRRLRACFAQPDGR